MIRKMAKLRIFLHFTLKNIDKRISTVKSLTPKKPNGTIKNKVVSSVKDSDSDSD
jgi:hypothetical protein